MAALRVAAAERRQRGAAAVADELSLREQEQSWRAQGAELRDELARRARLLNRWRRERAKWERERLDAELVSAPPARACVGVAAYSAPWPIVAVVGRTVRARGVQRV